jgi:hypothetical protein
MSSTQRIARALVAHADNCMPAHRREWSKAMRAEFDQIKDKDGQVNWALGCVIASYRERFKVMNRSSLLVSKWVIGIEALLCFGPLSLLWFIAVARLHQFLHEPKVLVDIALTAIDPLSLIIALRFVLLGKALNRSLQLSLAIAFLGIGLLMIAGKYLMPNQAFFWGGVEWELIALFSILPAFCCWHLSLFAKPTAESLRVA